jgi:CDGSH-type Zn-finger protein
MNDSLSAQARVQISKNGHNRVSGNLPLAEEILGADGARVSVKWQHGGTVPLQQHYALCRCGHSAHKPFCDGSHAKVGFDGTETASRAPYREQAKVIRGPAMTLTDAESLCAFGRFCDPNGSVWNLVNTPDRTDREHFARQSCDCPSGRLVAWDNATGDRLEPKYEPSISLVQDPGKQCSGPLWLRGGVQLVAADGHHYEIRNRMTLCRCGASKNKPFCDGAHASIGFSDQR